LKSVHNGFSIPRAGDETFFLVEVEAEPRDQDGGRQRGIAGGGGAGVDAYAVLSAHRFGDDERGRSRILSKMMASSPTSILPLSGSDTGAHQKRTGGSIWSMLKAKKTVLSSPSIRVKAGLGMWLCPLSGLKSGMAPARQDLTCGAQPEPRLPSCSPASAELRCARSSTSGRIREIRLSCRRTTPLVSLTLQTRSEKETTPCIFPTAPTPFNRRPSGVFYPRS
jgi:hypothetical protein